MRRVFAVLLGASLLLAAADQKRKQGKPPDLHVLEMTARRLDGVIALDARIRNSGVKPISGLVLLFDFMAPGRQVITTQKTTIDEEPLEPGAETMLRLKMNDAVRAVRYRISAADRAGRDLRLSNSGPFTIE